MKKEYITPTTKGLLTETTPLMTNSMKINSDESDYVIDNQSNILSRKGSFWDKGE